jgi:hypothetical protein
MLNRLVTMTKYAGGLTADERREAVEWAIAEIARLEEMVYVPGLWRCTKCDCRTMRHEVRVADGAFRGLNDPQQCPNGCGPMWRVTERDAGNDLAEKVGQMGAQIADMQRQIGQAERLEEQTIEERDRYSDALLECSELLDGPEWCAKMPPELPPHSGDLSRDVPVLIRRLKNDMSSLEQQFAGAQSLLWMVIRQSGGTFKLHRNLVVAYDARTAVLEQNESPDGGEIIFKAITQDVTESDEVPGEDE